MDKTVSEVLFEDFCSQNGIRFTPIPRASRRTPDYDIFPANRQVVAELKQIDPNPQDREAQRRLSEGGIASFGGEAGKRVRQEIIDARQQLRSRAKGRFPALLVLYNNVETIPYTDPMFILIAMYGQLNATIAIPKDPSTQPFISALRFGGKRTVTEDQNTTISAVALLHKLNGQMPALWFYHNYFAAKRFEPNWLRIPVVKHYSVREGRSHKFEFWSEV